MCENIRIKNDSECVKVMWNDLFHHLFSQNLLINNTVKLKLMHVDKNSNYLLNRRCVLYGNIMIRNDRECVKVRRNDLFHHLLSPKKLHQHDETV